MPAGSVKSLSIVKCCDSKFCTQKWWKQFLETIQIDFCSSSQNMHEILNDWCNILSFKKLYLLGISIYVNVYLTCIEIILYVTHIIVIAFQRCIHALFKSVWALPFITDFAILIALFLTVIESKLLFFFLNVFFSLHSCLSALFLKLYHPFFTSQIIGRVNTCIFYIFAMVTRWWYALDSNCAIVVHSIFIILSHIDFK